MSLTHGSATATRDEQAQDDRQRRIARINLQLAAMGQPIYADEDSDKQISIARDLLRHYSQLRRLMDGRHCPADQRIQGFLDRFFAEQGVVCSARLPEDTFILDAKGLARELSLAPNRDHFRNAYLDSYRVVQGVLHNPVSDRRTTKGVFHIVEGGLPIPCDKKAVPVATFARLFEAAMQPPDALQALPFTDGQAEPAHVWVSLMMHPHNRPDADGVCKPKYMETRFFAPGGLVSNCDFVESIFGNAGDPYLLENDAGLDVLHWSGHSGCVILAPHLTQLSKQALGLPHVSEASERQRHDGMCWEREDERYNEGQAFKVVCRDHRGVIVTLIADNYFGYSKKEIKTQLSYSTNLFGGCEEEHAGGALAFPAYNYGEYFRLDSRQLTGEHHFDQAMALLGERVEVRAEGYAVDRHYPRIVYLPTAAEIDMHARRVFWPQGEGVQSITLLHTHTYIYPCGYKVRMEKHPVAPTWHLTGVEAEGTFCHKPSTVSGGGKSEISKEISDAIIAGTFFVGDLKSDLDEVEALFERDYSQRFRDPKRNGVDKRKVLSESRTLGSVIKLLTPSESEYSDAYNAWLESVSQHIRALVFLIKRFYRPEWGDDWRRHFSVDLVNGHPDHEIKYDGRTLVASYLRVGRQEDGSWRLFKLRQDFIGADKVQMEDDISVSTVVPAEQLSHLNPAYTNPSVKLVDNCETRLFQRPDEAITPGFDTQAEADLAKADNFISNFEPLTPAQAQDRLDDVMTFSRYTAPMQALLRRGAEQGHGYVVDSAQPRLVDGKPSPNVRYLQLRPDIEDPYGRLVAELGTRLYRKVDAASPVHFPVNAVLPGRRNNPPEYDKGIRPLAVYNPIHYQELPELFMDMIASLTGKSPSTTGAGSEGALTKGPFNALSPAIDLNNALVSYILTGYHGFSSAAGYIGTSRRIDHDVSLLIPEIWCRLNVADRDPGYMIERGYLERLEDFDHQGRRVLASRLGYRITEGFVHAYLGKLFDNATAVFDEPMLKPELQDLEAYVDGIHNIVEAQQRVAAAYLKDGTVEDACPPLRALLYIMAEGHYQGKGLDDPSIRALFTRHYLLQSDWYQARLRLKQQRNIDLWQKHLTYLEGQHASARYSAQECQAIEAKIVASRERLAYVASADYLRSLTGTLGADPAANGRP